MLDVVVGELFGMLTFGVLTAPHTTTLLRSREITCDGLLCGPPQRTQAGRTFMRGYVSVACSSPSIVFGCLAIVLEAIPLVYL